ncbi:hypothetical protein BER93_14595 [Xanthomonas fragariae]|nr:hypothetical protein BER92_14560 [Xanthomonas fragariae]AOD19117.1 hypothetical protein BER93_14595 [Xanthomonas fragariae]
MSSKPASELEIGALGRQSRASTFLPEPGTSLLQPCSDLVRLQEMRAALHAGRSVALQRKRGS